MERSHLVRLSAHIIKRMFEAETRRLYQAMCTLDAKNREILGIAIPGFMIQGRVFIPNPVRGQKLVKVPSLSFLLQKEGQAFMKDREAIDFDRKQIEQMLHILLMPCLDLQEVRDQLPEAVASLLTDCPFTRKSQTPGYLIKSDERAYKQFLAMVPKMEFYVATRLLY